MATLDEHEFAGRQWETGSVQNALAWRGAKAPHTGQPYSEALLLGISGGIAFGYFVFEYTGLLPHVALLTRNTFGPLEAIMDRLAIPQDVRQTTDARIAANSLNRALDSGHAPIVWADAFSLPYNGLKPAERMWGMMPIVVFGCEGDTYYVADRSRRPFRVAGPALTEARGRVKQDRFRQVALEPPSEARLPGAVQKGLWQCLSLFTEAPPRGSRDNFGLAAMQKWAKLLTNTRHKQSWERVFPPGPRLFQALAGSTAQPGAFDWIMTWGAAPGAERGLYADFLDEAATILEKPALREAAVPFRASAQAWHALAEALLPDEVPLLAEAKALHLKRRALFAEQGEAALDELEQVRARMRAVEAEAGASFPLSVTEAAALRERLAEQVMVVHDLELKAVDMLQKAMG
jgi:hypothetical protein